MTNEERLQLQQRMGTCEVLQFGRNKQSDKITKALTSLNPTYGGHALVDAVRGEGLTIIVAKKEAGARSEAASHREMEALKSFIIEAERGKDRRHQGYPVILIADDVSKEWLADLSGKLNRPMICGDHCKMSFEHQDTGDTQVSVANDQNLVIGNPNRTFTIMHKKTLDVARASKMNLINDFANYELNDQERETCRRKLQLKTDPCEVIAGDSNQLKQQSRVKQYICSKEIEKFIGGGHKEVNKSSGEYDTVLIKHGRREGDESKGERDERIEDIIKKIIPENGQSTDKKAFLLVCHLNKKEVENIAIQSQRPIVAGDRARVSSFIDPKGDLKLFCSEGFYKYTPDQNGGVSVEPLGKTVTLPRSPEMSRLIQQATRQGRGEVGALVVDFDRFLRTRNTRKPSAGSARSPSPDTSQSSRRKLPPKRTKPSR